MTIPPAGGPDHGTDGAHARAPGTSSAPRQNMPAGHGATDPLPPAEGAGTRDPDDSAVSVTNGAQAHTVPAVPESPPPPGHPLVYDLLSNRYGTQCGMLDGLCRLIGVVTGAVLVILAVLAGLAYIVMNAAPANDKFVVGAATTGMITVANFVRRYWWQKRKRKRPPRGGVSEESGDDGRAADGSGG
jgi:hypothetical protein